MRRIAFLIVLALVGFTAAFVVTRTTRQGGRLDGAVGTRAAGHPVVPATSTDSPGLKPSGMAWVPGGEFTMGTDDPQAAPAERPAHRVRVDGFWMDVTEVTNAQFRKFAEAT